MSEARGSASWLAVAMEERPSAEQEPQPVEPADEVKKEPIPGFYAGSSRGEPPVVRGRRKGALVIGAVVAVVLGAVLVLTMGNGEEETAGATTEPEPTPAADTEREPEVEPEPEQSPAASTTVPDDEAAGDEEPTGEGSADEGSAGATPADEATPPASDVRASEVVEVIDEGWNEPNRLSLVRVEAYDQSGHVISGIDSWKHVIGTMQPGQRIAVAEQMNSEVEVGGGLGRLDFTIAELPASDGPAGGAGPAGEVPQGSVQVGEIDRTANSVRTNVSYKVWSSYEIPLDANVYVIFRDGSGEIVGGASSFIDLPADGSNSGDFDLPAGIVSPAVESTEVHVVPRLPL